MTPRDCLSCGATLILRRRHALTCSPACRQRLARARRTHTPPRVMQAAPRWVRWELRDVDGRAAKMPLQVDGRRAAVNRSYTWGGFGPVSASRTGDGYGFVLGDGFGCYDLDGALERGRPLPWAADVLASIPEPVIFTEVSQSGRGVHAFVEAPEERGTVTRLDAGRRVERYTWGRYIAMTGAPLRLDRG